MGWDGAGGYNRQRNFSADASAGIKILASAMDQEMDDFASAMTLAWARDGQNTPTGNIPMGGNKFVNVAAATSVSDFMRVREFIENIPIFADDTDTGTNRISVSTEFYTSVSAAQAPADGSKIIVRMGAFKSASAPLFLNGYSANVAYNDGSLIENESFVSGGIYELIYNSVAGQWRIPSQTEPLIGRTQTERSTSNNPVRLRKQPGDIRRYGAVADSDGTAGNGTDNTAAIQAAIDVAEAGGPAVFIPGDDLLYRCASALTIDSDDVTVKGEGKRVSRLTFDSAGINCLTVSATTRALLKDFGIETNATNTAGTGLRMNNGRFSTIENVRCVRMATYGFNNDDDSWTNRYIRCVADACDTGWRSGDEANAVRIESLEVLDSIGGLVTYGIQMDGGGKGLYFDHAQLENCATAGIRVLGATPATVLRGVMFNHLYTEIPSGSATPRLLLLDDTSFAVQINKMVFDAPFIVLLGTTGYDSIADMNLAGSSFARIEFNDVEYRNSGGAAPTTGLFNISALTRCTVSWLDSDPALSTLFPAGIESGVELRNNASGMQVRGNLDLTGGVLTAATYQETTYTSANIQDAANAVNTTDKAEGVRIFNLDSNQPLWASGNVATDPWVDATGSNTITPA